jgi:deoxyribodipyrimidine photo-lyase
VAFRTYKDHVIFEGLEVQKKSGGAYTVFTPYSRMWKSELASRMEQDQNGEQVSYYFKAYPTEQQFDQFLPSASLPCPMLRR